MFRAEIVEMGDSLGFALPQELLDSWQIGVGDTIYAVATETGFRLMLHPPESADAGLSGNGLPSMENPSK